MYIILDACLVVSVTEMARVVFSANTPARTDGTTASLARLECEVNCRAKPKR